MAEATRRTKGVQSGPRSQRVVASVRAAVLEVLGRVGWAGLTMDGVAQAAGVHRTTLYRRWPSKAALVAEVIDARLDRLEPPADDGPIHDVLDALLHHFADDLLAPEGQALTAVLGASDPELAELGAEAHARTLGLFERLLTRAVARGELSARADVEMAAHLALAGVVQWVMTRRAAPSDGERARMVQAVLASMG